MQQPPAVLKQWTLGGTETPMGAAAAAAAGECKKAAEEKFALGGFTICGWLGTHILDLLVTFLQIFRYFFFTSFQQQQRKKKKKALCH